jgi:hypothetical protein
MSSAPTRDQPNIGKHLATFNLFREADYSLHVTIAEASGVRNELGASGAPLHLCAMQALRAAVELRTPPAGHLAVGDAGPIDMMLLNVAEQVSECAEGGGVGFWRSCTGCLETVEGYTPDSYPFVPAFKCHLGGGCSECGGIGAIWDIADYAAMADEMLRDDPVPPPPLAESVGVEENAARRIQARVASGEVDLRDVAALCGERWDQDDLAEILRLAALTSHPKPAEGMVMVPRKPTAAMLWAGNLVPSFNLSTRSKRIWAAMLSASNKDGG